MTRILFKSIPLFFFFFSSIVIAAQHQYTGPQIWEKFFVPALHQKFCKDNYSLSKVEKFIKELGGEVVFDHGGTRTTDPQVYAFLTRIGNAFGLSIRGHYKFPKKHLEAIDLQVPGSTGFKWFSTLIRYDDLSPEVAKLVEKDTQTARPHLSQQGIDLLEKLETNKTLNEEEAKLLVHEVIHNYFKRHGRPLEKEQLLAIAKESPEAANALLLGPDFSHIAISVNHLKIPQWYGLDVIDVLDEKLRKTQFNLLPEIQGSKGSKLRQISILADTSNFPILLDGGITSSISYPSKYVEFVQRGADLDADGKIQFLGNDVKLFSGFLQQNAEKSYSSTDPKSILAQD